jgi:hypothetical protein
LQPVSVLEPDNGLEPVLDMSLVHTLSAPTLVGLNTDSFSYSAIHNDDIQLMVPTGDIDLSLTYQILNFSFSDIGDVRRLISTDSGYTWLYFNEGWQQFSGSLSDKELLYSVANTTSELNALSSDDIVLILSPSTSSKSIRFLTLLRQESLSVPTKTISVGVNHHRLGYFEKIYGSNFVEKLSGSSLDITYIGSDTINELHLIVGM